MDNISFPHHELTNVDSSPREGTLNSLKQIKEVAFEMFKHKVINEQEARSLKLIAAKIADTEIDKLLKGAKGILFCKSEDEVKIDEIKAMHKEVENTLSYYEEIRKITTLWNYRGDKPILFYEAVKFLNVSSPTKAYKALLKSINIPGDLLTELAPCLPPVSDQAQGLALFKKALEKGSTPLLSILIARDLSQETIQPHVSKVISDPRDRTFLLNLIESGVKFTPSQLDDIVGYRMQIYDLEVLNKLIEKGHTHPEISENEDITIQQCIQRRCFQLAAYFAKNGANTLMQDKRTGNNLLHFLDDVELIRVLVHPKTLNEQNHKGQTPLLIAVKFNYSLKVLKELLDCGADPNIKTKDSHFTPLHYAAKNDLPEHIALLLEYGADPSIRDDMGFTPLDWARSMKKTKTVKKLQDSSPKKLI